jgi:glycosyltransferase involved in cell wall biosynthesis
VISGPAVWLVVPAYNEADRLDVEAFRAAAQRLPRVAFLFVDDGSTDETGAVLSRLCAHAPERHRLLRLERNSGKAEAVRRGVLEALRDTPGYIGFWDADLATPLTELPSFLRILDDDPVIELVMGARVKLLGRTVERHAWRHYLGRGFATATAVTLGLAVYDTQCGAKLFRVTSGTQSLFAEPFLSRWIFDVEILARMRFGSRSLVPVSDRVYELPLREWRDVRGSKLRGRDFLRASIDLARIATKYRLSGAGIDRRHAVDRNRAA